ncbi:hypothetical protein HPB47_025420 [Ixodes persulcatus]|uniref:Uncharacterized protein n=1 Tax=Ixodes persulcatus TaxID=34615 RepID=A0AC60Q1K1_IXOPE|nr:hypothetical protein HPB47_025420 [Ixodes persulcatus]
MDQLEVRKAGPIGETEKPLDVCRTRLHLKHLPLRKRISLAYAQCLKHDTQGPSTEPAKTRSAALPTACVNHADHGRSNSSICIVRPPAKKPGAPTLGDRAQGRLRCPLCSKRFSQYKTHKAHVQRHRQKDSGLYKCPTCDKRLVQRSSLITHLRIHTGERPFPCEDCPARFSDRSSYKKHRRTHSGEKPYQCAVCRKSFSQSGNLKRHTRKLHASSHEPSLENKAAMSTAIEATSTLLLICSATEDTADCFTPL